MTTNTVPGISALQCVISSLRDTAHLSDEGGELTDQLRELRDWALSTAAQPPADGALNTIAALRAVLHNYADLLGALPHRTAIRAHRLTQWVDCPLCIAVS